MVPKAVQAKNLLNQTWSNEFKSIVERGVELQKLSGGLRGRINNLEKYHVEKYDKKFSNAVDMENKDLHIVAL